MKTITLPSNLPRHYYEARRTSLRARGQELTPWWKLTAEQQADAKRDVEILGEAIRAAEEEQDVLAAYAAAASTTTGDCPCPGCSAVAALLELLKQAGWLEVSLAAGGGSDGQGAPSAAQAAFSSAEGPDGLEKAAREAVERWMASGRTVEELPDRAEPLGSIAVTLDMPSWFTLAVLDDLAQDWFDIARVDFWRSQLRSFSPGV
ncbi:hypothetical protein [Streptomyces longispororuber]|uniref:hypothetical protein n=1 Tax=Streptomyces longispororuber TaxID=68230 RepID=UPI003702426B